MVDFKEEIVKILQPYLQIEKELIEIPPDSKLGDYGVPCFKFAKIMRKAPAAIAADIAPKLIPTENISKIINVGPYINFFANKTLLSTQILHRIFTEKQNFGNSLDGQNKTVVVDFSSPNIAKPFGIAHIRSTVIGNSLCKLYSALGYKVMRINHLGDWGTQFGKLMVAYRGWGDRKLLEADGIDYLVKIYIEFGDKAKADPKLDEEARKWFSKLEKKDPEAIALWQEFREISLIEFNKYYKELEIEFDAFQGESFYNDKLEPTIEYIRNQNLTEKSEDALIVRLEDVGIPTPLILQKSDEASTYATRDLAAAMYRVNTYHPEKILYVVGAPQQLHFKQVFAVLDKLGLNQGRFVHVPFGNMTFGGQMMSTRKGNFILLRNVLQDTVAEVLKVIDQKNPELPHKDEVAHQVGIGAIIFNDLSNDRVRDVDFNWEKALSFEGETAPYLQYTHARICSIERKAESTIKSECDLNLLKDPIEYEIIKILAQFPAEIQAAAKNFKPNVIGNYLITLAQLFNKFYNQCPILKETLEIRNARLYLIECLRIVLEKGLALMGIHAPIEM